VPPRSSDEVRVAFLDFWQARDSRPVASSSLIPYNDPTVLLTTAGMQQFVPYFLGQQAPPHPRLVSVQKCFRTVDIDEVGDPSHLTLFEMLGNFSVGDYFKAEVIPWALEFLTVNLSLEKDRLSVTVHETDDESEQHWLALGIPADRIRRCGDEHNWWGPPGKTGPCGPDSEIFYALLGSGNGCGFPDDPPDCDCGRVEIWNLVFMQYFQDENRVRTPLPRKNVDTGMGLERASMATLGLTSIYETDLFLPIMQAAAEIAGLTPGASSDVDYALRVIADHGRAMTFLVNDGVVPGNGGREYVLRRIVRRAIRYGRRRLGIERPFLATIVDAVIKKMGPHHPELFTNQDRIQQVLENEEELFGHTLRSGSVQLDRLIASATSKQIPGERVFDLYQTYGFPVELTDEILREQGLTFDRAGYEQALAGARVHTSFQQAEHAMSEDFGDLPATESLAWTHAEHESRVLAVRPDRLVLEASPFYPEGGGQVGDAGWIRTPSGVFVVDDTHIDAAGHIVHVGHLQEGEIRPSDLARAEVDAPRRDRTRRHHTATHLLHRALKDVLGEGTSQQGSYVGPGQLRFDFNAPRPMTREQIDLVGRIVNERSMEDLSVRWEIMPIDQARRSGAVMMFGEKYGDEVRVVSIGEYSRELCGGTHTHHSGELGSVVLAAETGIGSGKRRIVAFAGQPALEYLNERLKTLERLGERLGAPTVDEAPQRLEALFGDLDATRRELEKLRQQQANESAGNYAAQAQDVHGVKVVAMSIPGASDDDLKRLVDTIREQLGSGVVVLGTNQNGRPSFVAGVTRDLAGARLRAGDILKAVAAVAGGRAGGPPHFATGGGGDPERIADALSSTSTIVGRALSGNGTSA
jgi:alanyl-tRNA synthetase